MAVARRTYNNNTRTREPLRRRCVKPRRSHDPFPAEDMLPPQHSDTPFPSLFSLPPRPDARPPTSQHIPRRRSSPFPSIFSLPSRALPLPHAATTHARRPHNPFPAEDLLPPQHSDTPFPSLFSLPRSPDAHPQAARCTPADLTTHSPQRHAAPPSVPLRAQKKRHRTVHVRCRMSRSTVVAVGHLGW